MSQLEESIVLILSSDAKKTAFGTGFIIARDQNYSYLLTCAHVLEQINGGSNENKLKILGTNQPVEIVCQGSSEEMDIALLKVADFFDKTLFFQQFALGRENQKIQITGYSSFDKNAQVKRTLKGAIKNSITFAFSAKGTQSPAWDIELENQNNEFATLEPGYSGSPLYDVNGQVLGVISHRRNGKMGHAFCISNLETLYPEIIHLTPAFQHLKSDSELEKIKAGLTQRQQDIATIYPSLIAWLDSVVNLNEDKEAQRFIKILKSFLVDLMSGEDVADFFTRLQEKQQQKIAVSETLDYQRLAKRLQLGEIALCIGADLPPTFDTSFKSSCQLPQRIAEFAEIDYQGNIALAEVCEQALLRQKRSRFNILSDLENFLKPPANHQPNIPLYELLSQLQTPFLAIIGGFDTALECYLKMKHHKFVSVICNGNVDMENKERFIVEYSDRDNNSCLSNESFSSLQLMEKGYSIIYYPRGYPKQQDTVLLAERDYFDGVELPSKRYPDYLRIKLSRSGLWFLGYQPDSWETRLLAKVVQEQRGKKACDDDKAIVIQEKANDFSRSFWDYNRCHYQADVSLKTFVENLKSVF